MIRKSNRRNDTKLNVLVSKKVILNEMTLIFTVVKGKVIQN